MKSIQEFCSIAYDTFGPHSKSTYAQKEAVFKLACDWSGVQPLLRILEWNCMPFSVWALREIQKRGKIIQNEQDRDSREFLRIAKDICRGKNQSLRDCIYHYFLKDNQEVEISEIHALILSNGQLNHKKIVRSRINRDNITPSFCKEIGNFEPRDRWKVWNLLASIPSGHKRYDYSNYLNMLLKAPDFYSQKAIDHLNDQRDKYALADIVIDDGTDGWSGFSHKQKMYAWEHIKKNYASDMELLEDIANHAKEPYCYGAKQLMRKLIV